MIKSMTGFGRGEISDSERKITIEMKSVNHRYLDISLKMPKKFSTFEAAMRGVIREYAERGKLDIYVTCEDYTQNNICVRYNKDVAASYLEHLGRMAEEFSLENDLTVSRLSRYPEVFTLEEQNVDENELWSGLEKALRSALSDFVDSRVREGENLRKDIEEKLREMLADVDYIEKRAPAILEEYRQKLYEKVKELVADTSLDDSRILTEVTVYADKICVDEELVRLKSHINAMLKNLKDGGGVGRKLDFIAQEMNREANTILSKANDLATSDRAIDLKTGIEKVREQVQNIE